MRKLEGSNGNAIIQLQHRSNGGVAALLSVVKVCSNRSRCYLQCYYIVKKAVSLVEGQKANYLSVTNN